MIELHHSSSIPAPISFDVLIQTARDMLVLAVVLLLDVRCVGCHSC